jgi:hypothetical protein
VSDLHEESWAEPNFALCYPDEGARAYAFMMRGWRRMPNVGERRTAVSAAHVQKLLLKDEPVTRQEIHQRTGGDGQQVRNDVVHLPVAYK